MNDLEFLSVKDRYEKAKKLRAGITTAKNKVTEFTRLEEKCKSQNKKDWAKKKLLEWISKLNNLKTKYKNL